MNHTIKISRELLMIIKIFKRIRIQHKKKQENVKKKLQNLINFTSKMAKIGCFYPNAFPFIMSRIFFLSSKFTENLLKKADF